MRTLLLAMAMGCSGTKLAVEPLDVDLGRYWLVTPSGLDPADGPLLLHLHANGAGERDANDADIQAQLDEAQLVAVFPDGGGAPGDDWNVGINKDDIPRDDTVFLAQVATDLRDRFGEVELWLGGSSKGGAMTFEMACLGEPAFTGFLPIAGAIEAPLPGPCTNAPRPIRHLEGEQDDTWPLYWADDPDSSHMGIMDSLDALTTTDPACFLGATPAIEGDCRVWSGCAEEVRLCYHPGGHHLPADWVARQMQGMVDLGSAQR